MRNGRGGSDKPGIGWGPIVGDRSGDLRIGAGVGLLAGVDIATVPRPALLRTAPIERDGEILAGGMGPIQGLTRTLDEAATLAVSRPVCVTALDGDARRSKDFTSSV